MFSSKNLHTPKKKTTLNESPDLRHAKTRKEIAAEYGIDTRTLNKWLQRRDIVLPGGNLCPSSQQLVYETLGWPTEKPT